MFCRPVDAGGGTVVASGYGIVVPVTSASAGILGVDIGDAGVEASAAAILAEVESALRAVVASDDTLIAKAALHGMEAGGKRFRPMLVALGAQFGAAAALPTTGAADAVARAASALPGVVDTSGLVRVQPAELELSVGTPAAVIAAAVVVELTHLATLYHDDVMDEADVRRGAASVNARWTNSIAILVGDYLFARAASVAATLGPEAVRIQAATFSRLVHGQIAETVGAQPGDDAVAYYLQVLADKTGSLIATSVRFGAMFSGAPPAESEALAAYAETIGIAYQLSDDVLDIASESAQSGKTPGTDLREGVPTLPVLYALAAADDPDPDAVRLRKILSRGAITDDAEHAEALALLRRSAALTQARETVRSYAERARSQLAGLPAGSARRGLESVCDLMADRTG
jgi:heptaprenyl diphosphate synthase